MATTATQLGQYALNVAIPFQNAMLTGQAEAPTKGDVVLLCGLIAMLAEAVIAINNSSTVTSSIPNSLITGKWSVTQSANSNIQV